MTESALRVTFECHTECIYTRRQAMDEEAHKQTHTHTHTHTYTYTKSASYFDCLPVSGVTFHQWRYLSGHNQFRHDL